MSPQSPSNSSTTTEAAEGGKNPASGFGANEWLVDEIYQQYLQDPNSVDRAWWDFFADYKPGGVAAPVKSDGAEKPTTTTDGASAQAATTVAQAPQVADAATGAASAAPATAAPAPAPTPVSAPAPAPATPSG
ncbi:multifunctional oxoglutarate decarboxylase/oxoglutarate dehydrogenase thiamine pyrophosphate-binding subunit/dihydrolipoyllysine-residue succinyltransferase subunit, partial [Streptomyces sp. MB09-01]|nr:multifunctional oxoglutarate decarboxylase/oxoglutarate dehydrogenase thiamine pyrophosphate-binding subunit/dihydrolipoyllysine-residue succinyltransferase subunit [Streptomyces sp. MB09-01]